MHRQAHRPLRLRRGALLAATSLLLGGAAPQPAGVGQIEGTVRDSAGSPVAHAEVIVVRRPWTAMSDSVGRYHLADIPAGTYTIRVSALGYRTHEMTVVPVTAGGVTPLDFSLQPSRNEAQELTASKFPGKDVEEGVTAGVTRADERDVLQLAAPRSARAANQWSFAAEPMNTENYAVIEESRFLPAGTNPRSTFSIDVDAASYTNVRRYLTAGQRPPRDAVRIEELLNYFRYDYPEPKGRDRFSVTTDLAVAPWAAEHRLLRIGIKGRSLRTESVPPSNLVFLLDVSGSMQPPNKLPLVKQAFRLLVQELRPEDRVAVVVYAGAAGLVLPSTPGSDKAAILAALDRLEAGGSTAGGAGLRLAYEIAKQHYAREGNNRVILATDGDFNVGESSDAGDGSADRRAPRPGNLPHRARLRHRKPEGQPDGADRGQGERALRLRGQPQRGPAGLRAGVRRNAGHHREGCEDPGRVQPGQGGGVPTGGLREPRAPQRGLRRRP